MDNNGQERIKGATPFLSANWSGVPSEKLPAKDPHRHCPHRPGSISLEFCSFGHAKLPSALSHKKKGPNTSCRRPIPTDVMV
eukprot:scaffold15703_cov125-Skeletonema_dohrnii-CCMP3373.AAC.1